MEIPLQRVLLDLAFHYIHMGVHGEFHLPCTHTVLSSKSLASLLPGVR